jgi:hypothetical protein
MCENSTGPSNAPNDADGDTEERDADLDLDTDSENKHKLPALIPKTC